MNHRPLGKTGFDVSPLGFGGAPIGYLKTDRQEVAGLLAFLLDQGVNLLDTAASYPGSEEAIGELFAGRRSDFVLVSKCGTKLPDLDGIDWSEDLITKTVDRSLRRLKTDALDVMLLHSCDLATLQKGEAIGALVKAREAGKIRFAGYSGDNEAAAYAAAHGEIAVIETSVNVADQANLESVLPVCAERGVGVLAKRPIANAAWKDASEQRGIYVNYAKNYARRLKKMNLSPADLGFPAGDAAWPELALRFTLSQPGVTTAIIGTTSRANAEANLAAAAKGPLPEATVATVRAAFAAARDASWTGQT